MKKFVLVASLVLLGSACSTATQTVQAPAASPEETTQAIAAAEEARSKVAAVGFEWRDTAKLIKEAKKAAAANDNAKAIKLAKQAQRQSENAMKQYQASK